MSLCPVGSLSGGHVHGVCVWESLSRGLCPGGLCQVGVSVQWGSLSGNFRPGRWVSVHWVGLCPLGGGSLSGGGKGLCLGGSLSKGCLCPRGSLSRGFSLIETPLSPVNRITDTCKTLPCLNFVAGGKYRNEMKV